LGFWFRLVFLSLALLSALPAQANHWLKTKYEVKKVMAGDKFSVNFNGMSLVVKLVSVKITNPDGAKALLEKHIQGEKVTIIPDEDAGVSPEGLQLVYNVVAKDKKKFFMNELLIKEGFADYVPVKSKRYGSLQSKLKTAFAGQKKSTSSTSTASSTPTSGLDKSSKVCSELYSRKYHLLSCRWAKMINAQSRIIYDGFEPAEKAKKMPCSHCLYERVKEVRKMMASSKKKQSKGARKAPSSKASSKKPVGGLIGIKGDKSFYSPVSKKLSNLTEDRYVIFASLKEARASGRRPDPGSLRIENPVVPGPEDGECIGRGLPYLRPCRRDAAHETGLCDPCLNGRVR
jgi:hypothetical protein